MKESTLLEMKKKIESLTNVVQYMINELKNLKELGVGTLETIKKLTSYKKALDKLKADVVKKVKEPKHFETVEELKKHKGKNNVG